MEKSRLFPLLTLALLTLAPALAFAFSLVLISNFYVLNAHCASNIMFELSEQMSEPISDLQFDLQTPLGGDVVSRLESADNLTLDNLTLETVNSRKEQQSFKSSLANTNPLFLRASDSDTVDDTEAQTDLQAQESDGFKQLSQDADIIGLFALSQTAGDFLSVSVNGKISVWKLKSGQEAVLFPAGEPITACAYDPNARLLAVSQDRGVSLYDLNLKIRLAVSPDFGTKSAALDFAPDGNSLLVGGEDGKVYRWRLQAEKLRTQQLETEPVDREVSKIEVERYIGHSAAVSALAYHPFSRMFFSADSFGTLAAWLTYDKDLFVGNYDERKNQTTYYAEDGPRGSAPVVDATTVLSIRVSKDGQNLFLALQDGRVEWRLVRGLKVVILARANKGAIYDMQLSPSGNLLATVARDGVVRIWKTEVLEKAGEVPGGRKLVPEINDFKKDSLGYLSLVKEFPLEAARKLLFLSDSTLIVGENSGRLLELSL